jgi:phenylalanyl-tRNA synthetase beta chain
MKVLLSWLREFVDVTASADEIAALMGVRGFAVEGIERLGAADAVIDFEVTGNRPDCMSVVGIAREVATAYNLPLKAPGLPAASPGLPGRMAGLAEGSPAGIDIVIDAPDLCPRYAGAIADVTIGPSPEWMRARLTAGGVRPISNIVDITNYVMLELGQPMHAFDHGKIGGRQIRVRRATPGERLRTLDDEDRTLDGDMLVIADAQEPMAVGGVKGGAGSEIGSATKTIVFEAAHFNPLSVRRTSKRLGLKTDASMRFERGSDPGLPAIAMQRAIDLLHQIGAGTARGPIVDCHPAPVRARVLRLRQARLNGLLGTSVPEADVLRILERLDFKVAGEPDGWEVTVPTRRVDVLREVDLIEEVARHYGLDRIPATYPAPSTAPQPSDPRVAEARRLRAVMTGAGFSEAMTFGFTAEAAAAPFAEDGDLVPIANPLSENFAVLRPSALPGLIEAVAHNRRREQRDVRLFEIGNRFSRSAGERPSLACVWAGAAGGDHWSGGSRDVDFFDIKAAVERVCLAMGLATTTEVKHQRWLVPGRAAAAVVDRTVIATLGQLLPAIAERHGLPAGEAIYVGEIDLDTANRLRPPADVRVTPLPRFPSVTRDIALLVSDTLAAEQIRQTIRAAAPATLASVREFDRYQGKGVPDGSISVALRLTFRALDRTLTDAEIQGAMDTILASLNVEHGAVQR